MRTVILFLYLLSFTLVKGKSIEVCSNCEYKTLKSAVASCESKDIILLKKGIYAESNIEITKSLSIVGEEGAILDGKMKGEILTIHADAVTIKNLTFRNVGMSYIKDWAAISSDNSDSIYIIDNLFENSFFGIYLRKSKDCVITGNVVHGEAVNEISSGNAIHLWYCKNMLIENNEVFNHRDGIYFEFVKNSVVKNNVSRNNVRYGLHFMFSDNDDYFNNTFKNNGSGVAVMYSQGIMMVENNFEDNWGPASYGLLLKDIKNGEIRKNKFHKNTTAIFGEGVMRMKIEENVFSYNGWAIKVRGSCSDNTIIDNDFISNSFSVFSASPRNNNTFNKNYWSEYAGYDLNKDGFGDVPHRPVSLFTFIVEQSETTLLLMRSNFIALLELAEKAAPSITPKTLVDSQPRMKPLW